MKKDDPIRIYVDCSMYAGDALARQNFEQKLLAFEQILRNTGVVVLNFATPCLPFDPFNAEIADFVKCTDAVVALHHTQSAGFSFAAREAADQFQKPRFLFVPHDINLCLGLTATRQHFRCLYATDNYPARVLHDHLTNE